MLSNDLKWEHKTQRIGVYGWYVQKIIARVVVHFTTLSYSNGKAIVYRYVANKRGVVYRGVYYTNHKTTKWERIDDTIAPHVLASLLIEHEALKAVRKKS